MSSVFDTANYILRRQGPMTAMKLQKLVYYCQAWSLVWDERPLFPERVEAWANGPVVPVLFDAHRGKFQVSYETIPGNPDNLDGMAVETIEAILKYYGNKSSQWLSELTHSERPWIEARSGMAPGERGSREITLAVMHEYYESLLASKTE
jgi:uncharacterized phage-associated protein